MKSWLKSKAFIDLQKEWELKLKEAGFVDIEKGDQLKQSSNHPYRHQQDKLVRECKEQYYRALSGGFSDEKNFADKSDRLIMEWTVDGLTIKEIGERLKKLNLGKFDRHTISYVRRRYENKWGIKKWKPEQMKSRKKAPIR